MRDLYTFVHFSSSFFLIRSGNYFFLFDVKEREIEMTVFCMLHGFYTYIYNINDVERII